MDNDSPLYQAARSLYKGASFRLKYAGVPILSAAAGNDAAAAALRAGQPFLFGRCGATEMRTVAEYLQNGGHGFSDTARRDLQNRRVPHRRRHPCPLLRVLS